MRVLIIGAGIGGTCLAHGLRKAGIEVALFERKSADSPGLPGYGIHINVFGQRAMKECLPEQNWLDFVTRASPVGGKAQFFDERLCLLAEINTSYRQDGVIETENRLSISRAELCDLLLKGLGATCQTAESVIHWQKEFSRYELLPSRRVRVFFTDGSFEDGDLLVAADGSNSRVRQQYLPHVRRLDVGVTTIVGRTRFDSVDIGQFPASLIDGSPNSIVPRGLDWMFVSTWRAPVDPQSRHSMIAPYVVWAYIDAGKRLPADVRTMSAEQRRDMVLGRINTWDRRLSTLIQTCESSSVSVVPLKSMPPLAAWEASPVTLLGDAIHNMTPMAGIGANTALRDAQLLASVLSHFVGIGGDLSSHIARYETEMRAYANDAVGQSLRNATSVRSASKFKRSLFRGLLRTARKIPAIERVLFAPGK